MTDAISAQQSLNAAVEAYAAELRFFEEYRGHKIYNVTGFKFQAKIEVRGNGKNPGVFMTSKLHGLKAARRAIDEAIAFGRGVFEG